MPRRRSRVGPAPCWPAAPAEQCRDGWKPSRSSRNRGNRASTGCTAIATTPRAGRRRKACRCRRDSARALAVSRTVPGPAVIDEHERDIGPLRQQPDGGPRVRWSPVRTGARLRKSAWVLGEIRASGRADRGRRSCPTDATQRRRVRSPARWRGSNSWRHPPATGRPRPLRAPPVRIDADQRDLRIADIHFEEGEEAPLEIAQVAFQPGKAVSDSGLQPRRNRVSGDGRTRLDASAKRRTAATFRAISFGD